MNARITIYPDGDMEALICDRAIWTEGERKRALNDAKRERRLMAAIESGEVRERIESPRKKNPAQGTEAPSAADHDRAVRRAKKRVRDLVRCNPQLTMFYTFTLDKEKIDRYDTAPILKALGTWLDNAAQRQGFEYILTPEYHKDGAIHFHALGTRLSDLSDSGHKEETETGQKVIYNVNRWKYGFTTAIEIGAEDDRQKVAGYVAKYITKNAEKIGGRYFRHSQKLVEPQHLITYMNYDETEGEYEFRVSEANASFKILKISGTATEIMKLSGDEMG